uniref:Uncharacterized protein n=1 Tax=Octopus bimaculoides TaxID=37653 RepID=A0A0L8HNF2_OCTBM
MVKANHYFAIRKCLNYEACNFNGCCIWKFCVSVSSRKVHLLVCKLLNVCVSVFFCGLRLCICACVYLCECLFVRVCVFVCVCVYTTTCVCVGGLVCMCVSVLMC